ncbi:TatD family hydrolase [Candidatus Saccharibacteria bacterium]|nr:MAG: TatD family hydrolase [Candidatus Saccharibacteria bacterium]
MTLELFDTHCHVHEIAVALTPVHDKWHADRVERSAGSVLDAARAAGVTRMIVIGTTLADSELAMQFAQNHDGVWASIGIHPHEAKNYTTPQKSNPGGLSSQASKVGILPEVLERFRQLATAAKVVAVGECGLDYYYGHSPKEDQEAVLRMQIELALQHDLPLSFHVRDAFDDFWPIFESYQGVRGVLHSFTDSQANMERAVAQGLYIGVNGIATFTRDEVQLVTYRTIPQHRLLLETDAPFLTPKPFRGKVCEPKHVMQTAEYLAALRDESVEHLAESTTANALKLLKLT